MKKEISYQKCINKNCGKEYDKGEILSKCLKCGNLLDVIYNWESIDLPKRFKEFSSVKSKSGVWKFKKLINFAEDKYIVSIGEGNTIIRNSINCEKYVGLEKGHLFSQYEGVNPTGSFKDNGMAGAYTHAQMVGARVVACASTGNTSAAVAAFAGATGKFKALVFIGKGKIALGKLSQSLEYGAYTLQIDGDFDDAMRIVQEVTTKRNIYLMNSLNPFRLEGQKTTIFRILEGLNYETPDWIVCPGGNLGNSSAFGKAIIELHQLGYIKKIPKLAIINAKGANTLYNLYNEKNLHWDSIDMDEKINNYYSLLDKKGIKAKTIASAIEINKPVNLKKAIRALDFTGGMVRQVSDEEIMDAKAVVGRDGIGCEPASAASVAGARVLRKEGIIQKNDLVVCVITGHLLKDPNATINYHNPPIPPLRKRGDTLFSLPFTKGGIKEGLKRKFKNEPISIKNNLQLEKVLNEISIVDSL